MKVETAAYTLIEIVVAITVLGILCGFLAFIFVNGQDQMSYAIEMQRAVTLAELYLTEVISTGRWDELSYRLPYHGGPIPLSSASISTEENLRELYDDCDDYNGFVTGSAHTLKNGQSLGEIYNLYDVQIQVDFAEFGQDEAAIQTTNLKRITVRVSWRSQQAIELSTILTNS